MTDGWKQGGCHCGAVAWEAAVPDQIAASECNCSICETAGFLHVFVARGDFRLLRGEGNLTEYQFNTGFAKHWFCKTCGVKSFYIPRSHRDGYSLNLRCMDRAQFSKVDIRPFDGRNWEQSAGSLDPLPRND